ncbi:AAA family ATPase [Amycolatopsis sp. NPDC004079]|uniref:AAA family ATPase n=1 Tax=Amycolatopsis sp. NPDC004079 TaxID=3154549 RepID=UPI0033A1DD6F
MTGKLPSKGSVDDNAAVGRRARITWASEIEPVPVVWAWELDGFGRVPAGSLSIAAGREGTGKSSFGLWVAAKITHGELPGSYHGHSRTVLYVAVEDSWKHAIVPRLIAVGADLAKVARFDVVTGLDTEATLSLPVDNDILEQTIVSHDVALVVIDPLMSVIAERIDTHREREVRRALDPLAQLADRTGAVILGIAHFGKGRIGDAASLITGSGAFKNVPRSIFGFARDEAAVPGVRVMTQVKNSLGRDDLPSLSYGIEEVEIQADAGLLRTTRLVFNGESERSIHDILRDSRAGDTASPSRRDDAADWLVARLTELGGSAPASEIYDLADVDGISKATLKRARSQANVTAKRGGGKGGSSEWSLAPSAAHSAHSGQGRTLELNEPNADQDDGDTVLTEASAGAEPCSKCGHSVERWVLEGRGDLCILRNQDSRTASEQPSPEPGSKLENRAPDLCPTRRAAFGRPAGGPPPQAATDASEGNAS